MSGPSSPVAVQQKPEMIRERSWPVRSMEYRFHSALSGTR